MRNRIRNLFTKMNLNGNPESAENDLHPSSGEQEVITDQNATGAEENTENQDASAGKTDSWQEKYADINDRYLRLYSEFDNFRKRSAKERIDFAKTASADIFSALLPILDDFDRAAKATEMATDIDVVKEGMHLIYQKMRNLMTSKGLEEMSALNEAFDPELHEAITSIPAPDPSLKGKVLDELEKGYSLNGKVIRFAKVVVAG